MARMLNIPGENVAIEVTNDAYAIYTALESIREEIALNNIRLLELKENASR